MPVTAPRISEKVEQAHIQQLLAGALGAKVYVLGHPSPKDGRSHRGTGQTSGLADLLAFIPKRVSHGEIALFVEAKATGGRLRPEQEEFRDHCFLATVHHVVGGLDAVIKWAIGNGLLKTDQVPHYRAPAEANG